MSSLGYLIFSCLGFASEKAKVNGPILPNNMINTIINLPLYDKSAVIPIDKPTVPKAEITSNIIFINGSDSVIFNINTETKINNILMAEIARDRIITLSLIALFHIVI